MNINDLFNKLVKYILKNHKLDFNHINNVIINLLILVNEESKFEYEIKDKYLNKMNDLEFYQKVWLIPLILNTIYRIKNSFVNINSDMELREIENINFMKKKKKLIIEGYYHNKKKLRNSFILLTNVENFDYYDKNQDFLAVGFWEEIYYNHRDNNLKITLNYSNDIQDLDYYYYYEITSYNSIIRPILALLNLKNISFFNNIIFPPQYESIELEINKRIEIKKVENKFKLDNSQSKTLINLLHSKNIFELVQGFPGTGKTKLIVNLIYYILSKNKENKNKIPKILVCSSSNNVVNDILRNFLELQYNEDEEFNVLRLTGELYIKNKFYYENTLNYLCRNVNRKNYYKKARSIMKDTDIFFTTLNYSGSKISSHLNGLIKYCIIDEACTSIEPDTLIPLQLNPKKVFLFGDPLQLPPIYFLNNDQEFGVTLFEKFMDYNYNINLLDTQYRMIPKLSNFSINYFYDGKIKDSYIKNKYEILKNKNYVFIDYKSNNQQRMLNKSYYNEKEIRIVKDLITKFKNLDKNIKFTIISQYNSQINKFKNNSFFKNEKIKTIDSFQGKENEIIIISLVRTNGDTIGFLRDKRRINVLLTRAKYGIYLIGKKEFLEKDEFWKILLEDINERGKIYNFDDNNIKF